MLENLEIKNTTNKIKKNLTESQCENIGKAWIRKCPKCNKTIYYNSKKYYVECIKKNSKCHNCPRPTKIHTPDFIQKSKLVHGNKYDYSKFEYKTIKTKGIIICPIHGEFNQLADSHLQGSGCPNCANNVKLTTEQFINLANKIHNCEFSYENAFYINNNTKIIINCSIHGPFLQRPHDHLSGSGCRKCFGEKLSVNMMSNLNEFILKSKKIHENNYDYSLITEYKGSNSKIQILCLKCKNLFSQSPNTHLNGHGCPHCINIVSKKETAFLNHLKLPNDVNHRQKQIKPLRVKVDGIRGNKIFEFLGDYWHGNPEKFNSGDINKIINKTFGELYNDTINRFKSLSDFGYKVYYIWELDFKKWLLNNRRTALPLKLFKIPATYP